MPMWIPDDKTSARWEPGRRISILEGLFWMFVVSVTLATTHWLGEMQSLIVVFYGSLLAVTWRLRPIYSLGVAMLIAIFVAVAFSAAVVFLVYR